MIICSLILGIAATLAAVFLIAVSILGINNGWSYYRLSYTRKNAAKGFYALQLIVGIVEFCLGIYSSSLSCSATCCRSVDLETNDCEMIRGTLGDLRLENTGIRAVNNYTQEPPSYMESIGKKEDDYLVSP